MALGVPLVPDIHVTPQTLTPLNPIPVVNLNLGGATDSQKCVTWVRNFPSGRLQA